MFRWTGATIAAPGVLTFTGAMGSAEAHAHAAIQIMSVTSGEVLLRDASGTTRAGKSAIIPAGVRHELICTAETLGQVSYYDSASPLGRAAIARLHATGLNLATVECWLAAVHIDIDEATLRTDSRAQLHPVLAQAIKQPPMSLSALASRLGISASRLGHLYSDELGLTYPTWRRWARLQNALSAVHAGRSLTEAAHEAGFADSAHLTRVCKAMFGITPSSALHATSNKARS